MRRKMSATFSLVDSSPRDEPDVIIRDENKQVIMMNSIGLVRKGRGKRRETRGKEKEGK